jgi:hypothetical protein
MRNGFRTVAAGLAFVVGSATAVQAQSIDPATFSATMGVGQTITINKTITLGPAGANLVDLFFLADNTGSMYGEIANMKAGATTIMNNLPAGGSYEFGVGEYNEDPSEGSIPDAYLENQGMTSSVAAAQAAVNTWSAGGGGDTPEANFYALKQMANTAAWRTGSQRIAVWFGDAESHTATTTQAQAIAALQAQGVTVIGFNSSSSGTGIDRFGQATAVTSQTGGSLVNGASSLSGTAFSTAVNAEISTATSTLDLVFGSSFSSGLPSGLALTFTCTDVLGCDNVGGGESRTFDLGITALAVGDYDFSVFASGVAAVELDHISVVDTVVPEPSTWVLLATGMMGMGIVAWRGKDEEV